MRTLHPGPLRTALAATLLSLLCAAPAAAQEVRAALRVLVTDATTQEPVRDARLRLRGYAPVWLVDESGLLHVRNLPPGTVMLEVQRLGYVDAAIPVSLEPGGLRDMTVALRPNPVALDPIRAEASPSTWARQMLTSRGFFERRVAGPGVFMEREDIMRNNPRSMTQLLSRWRRLNVHYDSRTTPAPRRGARPVGGSVSGCRPAFWVDGVLLDAFDINSIRPDNIEGLEIYRGASETPAMFNRGGSGCGTVVIWTRVN